MYFLSVGIHDAGAMLASCVPVNESEAEKGTAAYDFLRVQQEGCVSGKYLARSWSFSVKNSDVTLSYKRKVYSA
jgi:hypothetical protein